MKIIHTLVFSVIFFEAYITAQATSDQQSAPILHDSRSTQDSATVPVGRPSTSAAQKPLIDPTVIQVSSPASITPSINPVVASTALLPLIDPTRVKIMPSVDTSTQSNPGFAQNPLLDPNRVVTTAPTPTGLRGVEANQIAESSPFDPSITENEGAQQVGDAVTTKGVPIHVADAAGNTIASNGASRTVDANGIVAGAVGNTAATADASALKSTASLSEAETRTGVPNMSSGTAMTSEKRQITSGLSASVSNLSGRTSTVVAIVTSSPMVSVSTNTNVGSRITSAGVAMIGFAVTTVMTVLLVC